MCLLLEAALGEWEEDFGPIIGRKAMAKPSSLTERVLIQFVVNGEIEIDELGRIWRVASRFGDRWSGRSRLIAVERRRAEHRTPQGYLQFRAMVDGRRIYCMAHRLVWQHLNGDIPEGIEINHLNGLKDDNRPGNLVMCTAAENAAHAHRCGLMDQHGQRNPAAKLTDNQIAQIRLAYRQGGYTMEALAARFDVALQMISKVVRGQRRAKQGGPVAGTDQRHCATERDASTGRFIGKRAAGRLLDGRAWDEWPA